MRVKVTVFVDPDTFQPTYIPGVGFELTFEYQRSEQGNWPLVSVTTPKSNRVGTLLIEHAMQEADKRLATFLASINDPSIRYYGTVASPEPQEEWPSFETFEYFRALNEFFSIPVMLHAEDGSPVGVFNTLGHFGLANPVQAYQRGALDHIVD